MPATNVKEFIEECNVGMFEAKLGTILSEAAMAQCNFGVGGKKSKITIEFSFTQMNENSQVIVSHKIASSLPTKRGKKAEEDTTDTVFFVGRGGELTATPPKEEFAGQFSLATQEDGIRRVK
jgi:hypothetical protein